MALIFLGVFIVCTISSFRVRRVSPSQIAVTSSPMMSGPQFTRPQSTGLIIRFEGNAGVFSVTSCNRRQKQFPSLNAIQLIWSALPEKANDNAVKD